MINKLVIENLKHRWVRTLLSALVVGVQVMSILTLIGLSRGMLNDSAQRAKGTGADIFLKPDTGATFALSSGQIDARLCRSVKKQPHVRDAVGVLSVTVETITSINGVNLPEFEKINPGFRFLKGGPPTDPDGLIVDEYYARQNKIHVGDTRKLLNHDWHVSGIVQGGVLARLIVDLSRLQELTSNGGKVSEILVKLDDPAQTKAEVEYFNEHFKGICKSDFSERLRFAIQHQQPSAVESIHMGGGCARDCGWISGGLSFHVYSRCGANARDWNFEGSGRQTGNDCQHSGA